MSVGNLGGKVKKTIKQALNKIDTGTGSGLPPVVRPREISENSDVTGSRLSIVSKLKSNRSESAVTNVENLVHASSMELPVFGDEDEDTTEENDDDEDLTKDDNISSSPEQETVMPKSESSRPHVQHLFARNDDKE